MNVHSDRFGTCEAFNTRRKGMCKAPLDEYGMCAVASDHGDSAEAPREPIQGVLTGQIPVLTEERRTPKPAYRRPHNHDTFKTLCGPTCPRSSDPDDFH